MPSLILSPKDDPFLTKECYPRDLARDSNELYLETPDYGGHVGFTTFGDDGFYWHERRILGFLMERL